MKNHINKGQITTYKEPKAVPRIVCGLRNLQIASLNSETLSTAESEPADPACAQA